MRCADERRERRTWKAEAGQAFFRKRNYICRCYGLCTCCYGSGTVHICNRAVLHLQPSHLPPPLSSTYLSTSTMTAYSAFFSSGLLAPRHIFTANLNVNSFIDSPSSPLLDDASDIEVDDDRHMSVPETMVAANSVLRPRLRKRRSSLSIGTSINALKSPSRNASTALQIQIHLQSSPSRSRSGSLSSVMGTLVENEYQPNIASQGTSLVGRMRSGSVGTSLRYVSLTSTFFDAADMWFAVRPRRPIRRTQAPAPSLPPPTTPLPELPSFAADKPKIAWPSRRSSPPDHARQPLAQSLQPTSAAQPQPFRGELRGAFDEEMKEN